MSPAMVVLSGPSGCGKSSLVSAVLKERDDIYFSISTTTRAPREGEVEGVHYFYISQEQFLKEIEEGYFLEWAQVHGNYYGTSLRPVEKALHEGKLVIFDIDVQGHENVKKRYAPILTTLFITTVDEKTLQDRLVKRATDSMETIKKRIENAKSEMEHIEEYDYLLINDDFEKAIEAFKSVLVVARLKKTKAQIARFRAGW